MPKKRSHLNHLKSFQGTSSAGSKAENHAEQKPATVNERLGELRKLEDKDATQKKRELAETAGQRSIPPELRPILGVIESAPPRPKRGVQTRVLNRTPGPAPPNSWLRRPAWNQSFVFRGGKRQFKKAGSTNEERSTPNELLRFARMTIADGSDAVAQPPTLLHLALKNAAEQWELFEEEDLPALAAIPLRLRMKLLSYIGFYGPSIDTTTLEALTQGQEPVKFLDLAGLVGSGTLTLHRLVRFMKQHSTPTTSVPGENVVAESWDQVNGSEDLLAYHISSSSFSQLTHLSLSHPPPGARWRDLLSLSGHIPSVTHLSLAYWPRPTLTPNLVTTTVASQYGPEFSAGGSDYYSGLDKNFVEPVSILRQLSNNLLCLQWLDLEGCTAWVPALAFSGDEQASLTSTEDILDDTWTKTSNVTTIFTRNWKNLTTINCAQGWLPDAPALFALPRQKMDPSHRRIVHDFLSDAEMRLYRSRFEVEDFYDVAQRKAHIWIQIEHGALDTAKRINDIRRIKACKPVRFVHGWQKRSI